MKTINVERTITKQSDSAVLYVHGKGGNANEAEHFEQFFPDFDMYGFDYKSENPWDAKEEFGKVISGLADSYEKVILVAQSLGAFFTMSSGMGGAFERAFFISPMANMEALINNMMMWAGVTEGELQKQGIIPTNFGEDLSWEYLTYVRNNKPNWAVPTDILYGSTDNLQSIETIQAFVEMTGATLTVMEGGEHWFHTEEQMAFLDDWMRSKLSL